MSVATSSTYRIFIQWICRKEKYIEKAYTSCKMLSKVWSTKLPSHLGRKNTGGAEIVPETLTAAGCGIPLHVVDVAVDEIKVVIQSFIRGCNFFVQVTIFGLDLTLWTVLSGDAVWNAMSQHRLNDIPWYIVQSGWYPVPLRIFLGRFWRS